MMINWDTCGDIPTGTFISTYHLSTSLSLDFFLYFFPDHSLTSGYTNDVKLKKKICYMNVPDECISFLFYFRSKQYLLFLLCHSQIRWQLLNQNVLNKV